MGYTTLQLLKKMASDGFKFSDLIFHGFGSIKAAERSALSIEDAEEDEDSENQLDIWADCSLGYEGAPPDSYRVLNMMVMDWVDANEQDLSKAINPRLKKFLENTFPEIVTDDLDENFDDYIWEDQVDYFPEIDEEEKRIKFSLELVLDLETEEDSESELDL